MKGGENIKLYKIVKNVFTKTLYSLSFIILLIMILNNIFSTKKPLFIINHSAMIVKTGSMEPNYSINSFVVIKQVSIENLKVGDVIAYKSVALNGKLALHRITRITDIGFYTKGDNNNIEDNQLINNDTYIGKCIFHTNLVSNIINFIKNPQRLIIFVITPLVLFILLKKIVYIKKELYI